MSSQVHAGGTVYKDLTPIGMMSPFPAGVSPSGWLKCDGEFFDTNLYSALSNLLGTNQTPVRRDESRLGSLNYYVTRDVPDGYIVANGLTLLRSQYPELYEYASSSGLMLSDTDWQNLYEVQESVGQYSEGDGSTTFRVPLLRSYIRNASSESEIADWLKGTVVPVDINQDGQHHVTLYNQIDDLATTAYAGMGADSIDYTGKLETLYSPVTGLFSTTATTKTPAQFMVPVRPHSICYLPLIQTRSNSTSVWYIKALHEVIDPVQIDAQKIIQNVSDVISNFFYPGSFHQIPVENIGDRFLIRSGQLINNASVLYPELWNALQNDQRLTSRVISETEWQEMSQSSPWLGIGGVPFFVIDTEANTIRLPDTRGMYQEESGFNNLEINGVHSDAMREIIGDIVWQDASGSLAYLEAPENLLPSGQLNVFSSLPSVDVILPNRSSNLVPSGQLRSPLLRFQHSSVTPTADVNRPRAFGVNGVVFVGFPS